MCAPWRKEVSDHPHPLLSQDNGLFKRKTFRFKWYIKCQQILLQIPHYMKLTWWRVSLKGSKRIGCVSPSTVARYTQCHHQTLVAVFNDNTDCPVLSVITFRILLHCCLRVSELSAFEVTLAGLSLIPLYILICYLIKFPPK